MDEMAVEVEGLRELGAAVRRLKDRDLSEAVKRANKNAAEKVVERALPNVPVRQGNLRASVKALGTQRSGKAKAGKKTVPYAAAVHWGTGPRPGQRGPHNIARRPFLWDAAQLLRPSIANEYETEMNRLVDAFRSGGRSR